MIKTLVLVAALAVGQLQEAAKQAFDNAEKAVLGRSVVVKPVGKCPCGGKGYIIQGDGHRTDCPGTDDGKPCPYRRTRDAGTEPVAKKQHPADHGMIYMYSAKDNPDGTNPCVWCVKWKKEIMPIILVRNWRVKEFVGAPGKSVPYYEIHLYGKVYTHSGFMSVRQLNAILAKAKAENDK